MALFQPTNIIPSTFTTGAVDVAKDNVLISWQVNGNSAMTAFKIDILNNDEDSTAVSGASTGRLTANCPFYGTNRFGAVQMFTYSLASKWQEKWSRLSNGKEYKIKITQYWNENGAEKSLVQIASEVFKTASTPKITIQQTDKNYKNAVTLPNALATSIGYFHADYSQTQGDGVRFVQWQVANAKDGKVLDILADTGEINTPTLDYEFNGFFNGQQYAIRCIVESESGQQASVTNTNADGWIFFDVQNTNNEESSGEFFIECVQNKGFTSLEWSKIGVEANTRGTYALQDGIVKIDKDSSINWVSTNGFNAPWVVAIEFNIRNEERFIVSLPNDILLPNEPSHYPFSKTFYASGLINEVVVVVSQDTRFTKTISSDKRSCSVTFYNKGFLDRNAQIVLKEIPFAPTGQIAEIDMGAKKIIVNGELASDLSNYNLSINDKKINLDANSNEKISLLVTPTNTICYLGGNRRFSVPLDYQQEIINGVSVSGGDKGVSFRCVTIYNGELSNETMDNLYSNPDFKPSFYDQSYILYMTANFVDDINGSKTSAVRIYRQEIGTNILRPILYTKIGDVLRAKDYGIVSGESYTYWLYEYNKDDAYLTGIQGKRKNTDNVVVISPRFQNYSLMVCDYDYDKEEYHVRKQYLFKCNLSVGAVSNNNAPTLNKNFTPYPTRMGDTANYASGTLSGLIGAIYTVPALIEQIGAYKRTIKPSTLDYFDSVDLERELNALSTAPYQLFLRDMKGHLYMVATSGAITMTTDIKKGQQPITMSLPWVEIGDASNVTIIQTPDDYGWNNDNQLLATTLDVDPETGDLTANYPYPYIGTTFRLTGVQSEVLTAETPIGVTPAQFSLSDRADETTDGEVTATVTVNSEDK